MFRVNRVLFLEQKPLLFNLTHATQRYKLTVKVDTELRRFLTSKQEHKTAGIRQYIQYGNKWFLSTAKLVSKIQFMFKKEETQR